VAAKTRVARLNSSAKAVFGFSMPDLLFLAADRTALDHVTSL
jgi:hypothetical protein